MQSHIILTIEDYEKLKADKSRDNAFLNKELTTLFKELIEQMRYNESKSSRAIKETHEAIDLISKDIKEIRLETFKKLI